MSRRLPPPFALTALTALPALLLAGCGRSHALTPVNGTGSYAWNLPKGFPQPKVPSDNPMTEAKVKLGRHLFYDSRMSQNGNQSCASCHEQALAFTDGRAHSLGATGEANRRGAQSLVNLAYATTYTWANPLLQTLEAQAMVPLFGQHPVELGNTDTHALVARFAADPAYVQLFDEAFPDDPSALTLQHLIQALASFERTLLSGGSPYDRYFYQQDPNAISDSALRGARLFLSERLECTHCHSGFNLMDSVQNAATRIPSVNFHNTGLYNLDGQGAYPAADTGIMDVTSLPQGMGRFRAVTLRNVAVTGPYFHDGSAASLDAVLDHYSAGGRTIASGPLAGVGSASPLKSNLLRGFALSAQERTDLLAFFESLTDPGLLQNPAFSDPGPPQLAP